jgi:hypothetical protein
MIEKTEGTRKPQKSRRIEGARCDERTQCQEQILQLLAYLEVLREAASG